MQEYTLSITIALIGIALSVATFFYGRTSASRQDGKQDGTILSELGYLKSNTDDIKRRLDKQDERDRDYISRLTCVEQKIEQANSRIDQICRKAQHESTV